MSKTVVIHQPDFLSHPGFFHRFLSADLYVALDHVQFVDGTSRSWTHRDRIKTPSGVRWLTVSVARAPRDTAIEAIHLADTGWREQNLTLIQESYRKAPYYSEIYPEIESLYQTTCRRLAEFTLASIEMLCELFAVRIPRILSSSLGPQGRRNELLVDILKKVSATRYLSGVGARAYFDAAPFEQAGIEVVWQNYTAPVYPQLHGEFVPGLSSIDMLFNCGTRHSRELLRRC